MNRSNKDFPGRLSRLFIFWFSLAIFVPIVILLYFTADSFSDREKLLAKTVSENQKFRVLELEEFFESRFKEVYKDAFKRMITESIFGEVNTELDDRIIFSYANTYRHKFLSRLGIRLPSDELSCPLGSPDNNLLQEIERNSPIRISFALNSLSRNQQDFFDVLGYGLCLDRHLDFLQRHISIYFSSLQKEIQVLRESQSSVESDSGFWPQIKELDSQSAEYENTVSSELELYVFRISIYLEDLLNHVLKGVESGRYKKPYLAESYSSSWYEYTYYYNFLNNIVIILQELSKTKKLNRETEFVELCSILSGLSFSSQTTFLDADKLNFAITQIPILRQKAMSVMYWLQYGYLTNCPEVDKLMSISGEEAFYPVFYLLEQESFQRRYRIHSRLIALNDQLKSNFDGLSRALIDFASYNLRLISSEQILSILFFKKRLSRIGQKELPFCLEYSHALTQIHAELSLAAKLEPSCQGLAAYLPALQQDRKNFRQLLQNLRHNFYQLRENFTLNLKLLELPSMKKMSLAEMNEVNEIFIYLDAWKGNGFSSANLNQLSAILALDDFPRHVDKIQQVLLSVLKPFANKKLLDDLEQQVQELERFFEQTYVPNSTAFAKGKGFLQRFRQEQLFESEWDELFFSLDPFHFPFAIMSDLVKFSEGDRDRNHRLESRSYHNQLYFMTGFEVDNEITGDSDWSPMQRFLENVFRYAFFNYYFTLPNELLLMERALGEVDIKTAFHKFLNYEIGQGQMEVMFGAYPSSFNLDDYYVGLSLPPRVIYGGLLKKPLFREWFRLIFNHIPRAYQGLSHVESPDILRVSYEGENAEKHPQMVFDAQTEPEISDIIVQLHHLKYGQSSRILDSISMVEFFNYVVGLRSGNPMAMHINQEWNKTTDIKLFPKDFAVLQKELSDLAFSGEQLERFQEWLAEKKWFDLGDLVFQRDGQKYLGSIFPSERLDVVVFLSMPLHVAEKDIVRLKYVLLSVIIFTFMVALSLGRLLFLRIVIPIANLTNFVDQFSAKIGEFTSEIDATARHFLANLFNQLWQSRSTRKDEIGALYNSFHSMTADVIHKLEESLASNSLNEGLLRGNELSAMLKESCQRLILLLEAKLVCFVFFEADSKEKISFFISRQALDEEQQLQKEILHLVQPIFSADNKQKIHYFSQICLAEQSFKNAYLQLIEAVSDHDNAEQMVKHGFLFIADYNKATLNESRMLFLSGFCKQIVTVLSKAILDKMEKEAGKGRSVQLGLLPKLAPESARLDIDFSFVAAKYLGGDFFDFFSYPEHQRIGLIISDVSGKGIGPSLFGATCKVFLQWFSLDQQLKSAEEVPVRLPGDVLVATNDKLCEEKKNNLFATVFYCTLNTENLELCYASAGHNKMFHVTASGEIIELSAKGVPLGLFSPMFYQTKKLQLAADDWIILYTDGVTELEDPLLDLYDMTRFKIFVQRHLKSNARVFRENLETELELYRKGALFDGINILRRCLRFFATFYNCRLSEMLEFSDLASEDREALLKEFTVNFSQQYFAKKEEFFANNIYSGSPNASREEIEALLDEVFQEYTEGGKNALSGHGVERFLDVTSQLDSLLYREWLIMKDNFLNEIADVRRKIADKGLKALNTGVAASDDITFIVLRVKG